MTRGPHSIEHSWLDPVFCSVHGNHLSPQTQEGYWPPGLSKPYNWIVLWSSLCLKASVSGNEQWSVIDITLWNMTFPEKAIQSCPPTGPTRYVANLSQRPRDQYEYQPICLDWNENPNGCSRSPCHFKHICYQCVHNPWAQNKNHKTSQCTYRQKDRQYKNRS